MKNIILSIITIFIFSGCSNNDDKTTITQPPKEESLLENQLDDSLHVDKESYENEQWHINYNEEFYKQYNINRDAHIHIGDKLQTYTGKGVKIAIIDDSLDTLHVELEGKVIATYSVINNSSKLNNRSDYFHGTAVTGIISANDDGVGIKGIASDAEVIFLQHRDSLSDSDALALFTKAEELGADVINCSWGTGDVSESVRSIIKKIAIEGRDGKGIPIIFASGNNNENIRNDESSIAEVFSVGSSSIENLRSSYSNFGEELDLIAPGGYIIGITTLDPMGDNGVSSRDKNYLLFNDSKAFRGTSASAPMVSATIALMLEKNPELTREEIYTTLRDSADKIGNLEYKNSRNNYYGYGKLNVSKVLDAVKSTK